MNARLAARTPTSLLAGPVWQRYVFDIRPAGIGDALPYYLALVKAMGGRAMGRISPVSVKRAITVRSRGLVFMARPASLDLVMVALSAEPKEVARFLKPEAASVIVDVGANVGGYTIRLARTASRVIAIEPEPSNYRQLVAHIGMNRLTSVVPLQIAVSDRRGTSRLHLSADSGGHSLEPTAWGRPTGETVTVETVLLDDIIEAQALARIDWLKIDVERHELPVLRGASRCLDMTQNLILEFELSKLNEISAILAEHGLQVFWWDRWSENSYLLAVSKSHRQDVLARGRRQRRPAIVSTQA